MAGHGQRFIDAGYTVPKPYIPIAGVPMIERVMDSIRPRGPHRYTLLTRELVGETRGAVDTLLHAEPLIDLTAPCLVANCDQYLSRGVHPWLDDIGDSAASILTFNSTNPHHSYVKTRRGRVTDIAEKVVISDQAVLGVYWFRSGFLLMDYAEKVLTGDPVLGEYYVSSILDLMIRDDLTVTAHDIDVHDKHMLGTPEELMIFLDKIADGRVTL